MTNPCSLVESAYRDRIDAMAPYERVARSAAMFQWTREQIARLIVAERGPLDEETVKWLVARRLYGASPLILSWIERKMADVSG
jgi:hypothetical protein